MNLIRCHILGFGKLAGLPLEFHPGLNLVFAPNEGGKSTLQLFLIGILYGQLRADVKAQRRLDRWAEQYKPWQAPEYGGILWCRLAGGREVEIRRNFGREETRVEIRTATGEDITGQYERQRNGEVLFARTHLGMPKELFEAVAVIRENKVAELDGHETVRERIANLAQAGDEDLSIRRSLDKLAEALDSLGSERAPTKPYKSALDRLQSLQEERRALDVRRSEFQGWVEERTRLAAEVAGLEIELGRAQKAVAAAKWRDAARRVRALEEADGEICRLESEFASLRANLAFPAHRLEELDQLVGARDTIAQRLAEVRTQKQAASERLAKAEEERQKLAAYGALQAGMEAEKITEWFYKYLSLSVQKDNAQKSLAGLLNDISSIDSELGGLGPAFGPPYIDWQQKAREASEEELAKSQKCLALADEVSGKKAAKAGMRGKTWSRLLLGAVSLLFAIAPWAIRFVAGPDRLSAGLVVSLSALFAMVAAVLFVTAFRSHKAEREIKRVIGQLEADQARLREEAQQAYAEISKAMAGSGFSDIEEFLYVERKASQLRHEIAGLETRARETEKQRDEMLAQCDEVYSHLKETLVKVGLTCSPGSLRTQVDRVRTNLRQFRELDSRRRDCAQGVQTLAAEEESLSREQELKVAAMQAILDEAGVDSPEAFRQACRTRQRALELKERASFRRREFDRLRGDMTPDQWRDRARELESLKGEDLPAAPRREAAPAGAGSLYLPYFPSVEEAEQEERRVASLLSTAREEYARIAERVSQAFHNYRTASEIDEDLALVERRVQELTCNRRALEVALEMLETLSREQQEVLAPQLNYAVEQRFLRLCRGRYEEVKIDPDFQIWLREAQTAELRMAEQVSRGTQAQLYFALRFGILDLVSESEEPCPCLLDEPFAAYDRLRLAEVFGILEDEANHRQLLLFTCREDLRDLACRHNAHLIRMTNDE